MSDREFESYLSLLSKLLRLSPAQRGEVADELRDHLEERVAALIEQGRPRDEAVRLALEEFGDVAALARGFSAPRALRRRRVAMRGLVAAALAVCVAAFLFWPQAPNRPGALPMPGPAVAVAQLGSAPKPARGPEPTPADARRLAVEAKLAEPNAEMEFVETGLREVLDFLSERIEAPILLDRRRLEEQGIAVDGLVSFRLPAEKMSQRSALELILEEQQLIHVVREGAIVITTKDQESAQFEVRVYDCRDLLEAAWRPTAGAAAPVGGAAPPGPMGGFGGPMAAGGGSGMGEVGSGREKSGGWGPGSVRSTHPAGPALLDVITAMTGANWREIDGEGGELREYGGQVIVLHHQRVHRNIEDLLAKMRAKRPAP